MDGWYKLLQVFLITASIDRTISTCDDVIECEYEKRYHCQYDAVNDWTVGFCATSEPCKPGYHAVLHNDSKTVTCGPCSEGMYQPADKWTHEFTQPNCDYPVTKCAGLGQYVCEAATTTQNNKCACNITAKYKPNYEGCSCFSQESACECSYVECDDGDVLSKDFRCVKDHVTWDKEKMDSERKKRSKGVVIGFSVLFALFIIPCVVVYVGKKVFCRNKGIARPPQITITDLENEDFKMQRPLYRDYDFD